jgi:hypothetical protein
VAQSKSKAAEAFAAGAKLYKEANYLGAITAFERAYRLHPHFLISCNIARCHERRSDMVKAAEFYTRCLKEGGDRSSKAAKIRKALHSVESQIAWVTITSRHKTGNAFVNGSPVGQTPVTVPLNPGTFHLEVRRKQATPARMTIEAGIGEKRTVVLIPKPIMIQRTTETEEKEDDLLEDDDEKKGLSQVWFWTTAAAALGFAIAGTVMGVQTLDANNSYNEDPTEEVYNKVIDRRLATNVLWGLAVGAAAASTVIFFYTDFSRSTRHKTDKQSAVPSTFVLGVRGRF